MRKAHRKGPVMRRASRIFLKDVNGGKVAVMRDFLHQCRDVTQFFVDLFWQRQDFTAALADLSTVHRGRDRFGIMTRPAQALGSRRRKPAERRTPTVIASREYVGGRVRCTRTS